MFVGGMTPANISNSGFCPFGLSSYRKYIIDVPRRKQFIKEVYVKLLLRQLDEIDDLEYSSENEED